MAKRTQDPTKDPYPLKGPLEAAALKVGGRKPDAMRDDRPAKKNYAQALSNELATLLANSFRRSYPKARVTPYEDGSKQEFALGKGIDRKKTDVGVWDDAAGLALGISIKTYTFRDPSGRVVKGYYPKITRYVKNVKRNDMELRDEADILHRRQRYAVLAAIMFLPEDACWDGVTGQSSFAHHVFTLRKRTGRGAPDEPRTDLFEKVYVGLFREDGHVEFFDVAEAPPRNQPPQNTLTLAELVNALVAEVNYRNTGLRPGEDPFAPDDPEWKPPATSQLPSGLAEEPPVTMDDALDDGESLELEDEPPTAD